MKAKTPNRASGKMSLFLVTVTSATLLLTTAASAAVNKWDAASGAMNNTNSSMEILNNISRSTGLVSQPTKIKLHKSMQVAQNDSDSGKSEEESEEKGVVLVGELEFFDSEGGNTIISATVRNDLDIPVKNVSIDVIIFLKSRKRSNTINIRLTGGETPGVLEPGQTGEIEEEIDTSQSEIGGFRYRINYNYEENVEAPKEGEEVPEGVRHVIRPGKPKSEEGSAE